MKHTRTPLILAGLLLAASAAAAPVLAAEPTTAEIAAAETAAAETTAAETTAAEITAEENTAAEITAEENTVSGPVEYPEAGITFSPPPSWEETDGIITFNGGRELQTGSGIVYLEADYIAMSDGEYADALARYQSGDQTGYDEIYDAMVPYCYVFGINGGRTAEDLTDIVFPDASEEELAAMQIRETGSAGDFVFYTLAYDTGYITGILSDILGIYASPYAALAEDRDTFESGLSYAEPELEEYAPVTGDTIQFEGTDLLTGEPVTSEELFGSSKVTMINLWATWCIWCVREMPDLEALSKSFEGKDGQIIGIVLDTLTDKAAAEEAVSIMEEAGVTFRMIIPPENIEELLPLSAYPTTYFVDSSGTVLGEPVVGANIRAYSLTMESLLNR